MIRLATASDASRIGEVNVRAWQAAYRGHLPDAELDALDPARRAERWSRALVDPAVGVFVALEGEAIVGYASFRASADPDATPKICEIGALYVDPARWRSGHGRALVLAVLGAARRRSFEHLSLWVLAANSGARAFYERVGFVEDGGTRTEIVFGVSLAEVRYRQRLEQS